MRCLSRLRAALSQVVPGLRCRRALGLLLALLASLAGCGDGGEANDAGGPVLTLQLQAPARRGPLPKPVVIESFLVAREALSWQVDAPAAGREAMLGAPVGKPRQALVGGTGRARPIHFTRDGEYDASRFDAVRVLGSLRGVGSLSVSLWRDGRRVATSPERELPVPEQPALLTFELPDPGPGACDRLEIECSGGARTFWLREVQLVRVPVELRVPAPEHGPALYTVQGEARAGLGLLPGRPLSAELPVPEGAQLAFGWTPLDPPPERALLELFVRATRDVEDADADAPADRWPLRLGAGAWQRARVDLAPWAGQRVVLEFRVSGGHGAAAVLSDVHVLPARRGPAPTLLLVTSDTHRGDHVGYAGQVDLATPVLDLLAEHGTSFRDAWAPVNNTTPSHAALFTGTHPRDTGVLDNYTALAEAAPTLAEAFAEAGWLTWAVVSNRHLGPADSGLGQGWQRMSWPEASAQRPARESVEQALRWLPEAAGRPLLLWVHLFDAHIPYEPPASDLARHWDPARDPRDPALPELALPVEALPSSLLGVRDLEFPRAAYRAEVEQQDLQLGRLLASPRLQQALVAFVADHGEAFGEHGMWFRHEGVLPATLHVPLLLAGPGVPAGLRRDEPVRHLDLGRTLLDLSGLQRLDFPGRNLLEPVAAGGSPPRFALEAYARSAAVEHRGWLLVLHLQARDQSWHMQPRAAHEVELYHLADDPSAATNLVAGEPGRAAQLRAALIDWLGRARPGWASAVEIGAADRAALEQLGYVAPGGDDGGQPAGRWQPDDCAWCRRFE